MPRLNPPRITSWSFSRWSCYSSCPYKAKLKFIDKLKEPGSPQMDRGTVIHELAEHYVKAKQVHLDHGDIRHAIKAGALTLHGETIAKNHDAARAALLKDKH